MVAPASGSHALDRPAINDNDVVIRVPAHDLDPVDLLFLAEVEGDHNIASGFFGFDPYGGVAPEQLTIVTCGADGCTTEVPAHYELDWPTWHDSKFDVGVFSEGPPNRVLVAVPFEPVPISINFPTNDGADDVSRVFKLALAPEGSAAPLRDAEGRYLDLDGYPVRVGLDLSVYPDLMINREIRRIRRPSSEMLEIAWNDGTRSKVPALYELAHPIHDYEACDEDGEGEASGPPYWRLWPVPDERYMFMLDVETGIYSGYRRRTAPVAVPND